MTKQREAFEKWAVTRGYDICRHDIYADGYVFDDTHHSWVTWQAAQADKLEFARRVAKEVHEATRDSLDIDMDGDISWHGISIDIIIAKVGQE